MFGLFITITINATTVLTVLFWIKYLIKGMQTDTRFADAMLQYQQLDQSPLPPISIQQDGNQDDAVRKSHPRTPALAATSQRQAQQNLAVWHSQKRKETRDSLA